MTRRVDPEQVERDRLTYELEAQGVELPFTSPEAYAAWLKRAGEHHQEQAAWHEEQFRKIQHEEAILKSRRSIQPRLRQALNEEQQSDTDEERQFGWAPEGRD